MTVCETAGYIMCRHRIFGCGWSVIFRTFADEPEALRLRGAHESVCAFRPYGDNGYRHPASPSDRR